MQETYDVIVIGAGATGLACAHTLHRRGVEVLCLESGRAPGGIMTTQQEGGFLFEQGPNTIPASAPCFRRLTQEAGLLDRLTVSNPAASLRLVYRNGRLHPLPTGPLEFARSKLLSVGGKLRLMSEPFRPMSKVGLFDAEPSLQEFLVDRLGQEAAQVLGGAFVRGVYAAELDELGARSAFPRVFNLANDAGGIVRGVLKARKAAKNQPGTPLPGPSLPPGSLLSFPRGLGELPLVLARGLGQRLLLGRGATEIERGAGGWVVTVDDGARFRAESIVLATGPRDAHALLAMATPDRTDVRQLLDLPTANISVVHLGLSQANLPPAFGFLVPPDAEPVDSAPRLLGALFPSNIFKGHAPAGGAVVSAIYHSASLAGLDSKASVQLALEDLRRGLGYQPGTLETARIRHWKGVIPRYGVGHDRKMADLHSTVRRALPKFVMAGTWHGGVSVEDRFKTGIAAAEETSALLDSGSKAHLKGTAP